MENVEEFYQRLKNLDPGPWIEKALEAKRYLEPKTDLSLLINSNEPITLDKLNKILVREDLQRERELAELLRAHWDKEIESDHEILLRDSFDEALSFLQILELAIETGYIPVQVAHTTARHELLSLLWSSAARRFVRYYDYIAVEFFAHRYRIDLDFRQFTPPSPDPEASIHFASFLSQHYTWYRDNNLLDWILTVRPNLEVNPRLR